MPSQTPVYDLAPSLPQGQPPRGWSVFATVKGRSMDARSMSPDWVDDPYGAGAGDVQVGLGWRRPASPPCLATSKSISAAAMT